MALPAPHRQTQPSVTELLSAILDALERIRVAVEAGTEAGGRRTSALTGPDSELLHVLDEAIGTGHAFTAAGVLELAAERDDVRHVLRELNLTDAKRLGRRFGRLRRKGYLEPVTVDADGRWLTLSAYAVSQRHRDA